jgi:hypothetical protein
LFCFVSQFTRRRAEEVAEIPRAAVVPAGIDPADFPVGVPEERPWRWRLLCVGRLERTKGFAARDAALRRRLVVAGLQTAKQFTAERQAAALEEAHLAAMRHVAG